VLRSVRLRIGVARWSLVWPVAVGRSYSPQPTSESNPSGLLTLVANTTTVPGTYMPTITVGTLGQTASVVLPWSSVHSPSHPMREDSADAIVGARPHKRQPIWHTNKNREDAFFISNSPQKRHPERSASQILSRDTVLGGAESKSLSRE
jgi:hypothetical protein